MNILLILIFLTGYLCIILEHKIKIDKTVSALIAGILLWAVSSGFFPEKILDTNTQLMHKVSEIAAILFFLMGAMTIVEIIDDYSGFDIIINFIKSQKPSSLLWIISLLTFFLSALLDNLTTAIIMVTLIKKIVKNKEARLYYIGIIILAANAGGAWSPIGDVTTTMLWIGGQISALNIIKLTFLPSLVSLLVPLFIINRKLKKIQVDIKTQAAEVEGDNSHKQFVFWVGLIGLASVPIFKTLTHLPPFMGMLLALGVLWLCTEFIKKKSKVQPNSVAQILQKIDLNSILFFLGILLAVGALEHAKILEELSYILNENIKSQTLLVTFIGLISAVVDNVPLVAATIGMYDLSVFPVDHEFWVLLAYCAGTGGSLLIIGSAAGVAAMGLEKIDFMWYLKQISLPGLIGYLGGIVVFILQQKLFEFL